jgi:hypothetical protein
MEWAWLHKPAAPNLQLETEARAMLPMRMQEFGRGFIDACNEVSKN